MKLLFLYQDKIKNCIIKRNSVEKTILLKSFFISRSRIDC